MLREPDGRLLYTMSDGIGKRAFTQPRIYWKDGERHYLAITWSRAEMILYLDGRPLGKASASIPAQTSPGFSLGGPLRLDGWQADNWNGNIELIRAEVYARPLTEAEIKEAGQRGNDVGGGLR